MGFGLLGELVVQLATWKRTFRIAQALQQLKMSRRLVVFLLRDGESTKHECQRVYTNFRGIHTRNLYVLVSRFIGSMLHSLILMSTRAFS